MKKRDYIILGLILLVAIVLRGYNIMAPLSDAYSWRQADTASVARNFVRNGFDLLHPRYDDLSSIQSGIDNPKGLRFVEVPIYNALFGILYQAFPIFPIEVWGRIVAIIFSLGIIGIIYYLCLHEVDRISAIVSSTIYAIFPAFVFFSRVVLPETPALALSFISIFLLYKEVKRKKQDGFSFIYFFLSILAFSLSILIKPTTLFYGITLGFLFIRKYEFEVIKRVQPYLFFILALAPFFIWRIYIQQYPEGIPASDWLIMNVNTFEGQKNIFFKPAFFRWIFFERINTMIFGGFTTVLFIIGMMSKRKSLFLYSIAFSGLLYLFVFQGGNVQHEYYQTLILPPLAIFSGIGASTILSNRKIFIHPLLSSFLIGILLTFSFFFSYYYKVKDFYTYPKDLNFMAKIIQTFTSPNDKIVADRMGDTTLLYLSDRKGSPQLSGTAAQLKESGYKYVLTDQKKSIEQLSNEKSVSVIFQNNQFALLKL